MALTVSSGPSDRSQSAAGFDAVRLTDGSAFYVPAKAADLAGLATTAKQDTAQTRLDLLATETKLEAVRALLAAGIPLDAATLAALETVQVGSLPAVALDAPTLAALETITIANPTTNPETGLAKDATVAQIGAAADGEATGNGTISAILKRLRTLLAGGLPAALVGGRLDVNVGNTASVTGPLTDAQLRASNVGVTVSNPTTAPETGLAKDATLTGGTQKSIQRGGAKGATTAADLTSTAEGADHQALDVQLYHGGAAKDPTQIRALTSADVVTVNNPTTNPETGLAKDATVTTAVGAQADAEATGNGSLIAIAKRLRTLLAGGLPAALVGGRLDVNVGAALPAGTNTVGKVDQGAANATPWNENIAQLAGAAPSATNPMPTRLSDGAAFLSNPQTQAGAFYMRPRQVATYTALYRLAARPYALSKATGAAGRSQFATIFHAAGATKTVKIREVLVLVRSISAAAIVSFEFVRLTSAVTPITGAPAITPKSHSPGDASAEATCLALPGTGGTEDTGSPLGYWQMETAAVTPAVASAAPPVDIPWKSLYSDPVEDEETPALMRAANAEGFAVVLDANASVTVTGLVKIRFTEE